MDSMLNKILEQKAFRIFIDNAMQMLTYTPWWTLEMNKEYEPSKNFNTIIAEHYASMAGSVIDKNAEKPKQKLEKAGEISGTIARMADEWQMDLEMLDRYLYLERRYRDTYGKLSAIEGNATSVADWRNLMRFLLNPYEKACIAPHKRIDLMYFEGLYKGTITLNDNNDPTGSSKFQLSVGATSFNANTATWGNSNAKPLTDIQTAVNMAEAQGKAILRIRMSRFTYLNMLKSSEVANIFRINIPTGQVVNAPLVGVEAFNQYLNSVGLPPIEIESPKPVMLANGSSVNCVPTNKVVFMMADQVAVLKVSDGLERVDPLPNKVYANYNDNLVGQWRNEKGRFVDYEMWAMPVFTGYKNFIILNADAVQA